MTFLSICHEKKASKLLDSILLWLYFFSALDCGDPGTPLNGGRQLTATTLLAVVTYFCLPGYTLTGPASRECKSDGRWSASLPTCTRKCSTVYLTTLTMLCCVAVDCGDPGTLANGVRRLTTTTLNSVVTYQCNRGYELDGSSSRVCQATGVWSGLLPICRGVCVYVCVCVCVCSMWVRV